MLNLNNNELTFEINGYQKYRSNEDDSWANTTWMIKNEFIQYESSSYDLESIEVDRLKDMFKKFISGQMNEMEVFVPLEPAFKIRFYPKGDEYGLWYKTVDVKEPIIKPNIEVIVHLVDSKHCITESSYSYILEKEEVAKFYNYLVDITE